MQTKYDNIILLGCDKTGKSTLFRRLEEELPNHTSIKGEAPKSSEEALQSALAIVQRGKDNSEQFLMDRFQYPDEMVYNKILTGKSIDTVISYGFVHDVLPWLIKSNTLVIYCMAYASDIAERFKLENEELVDPEQIIPIMSAYTIYISNMENEGIDVLYLNSSKQTPEEMFQQAREAIVYGGHVK